MIFGGAKSQFLDEIPKLIVSPQLIYGIVNLQSRKLFNLRDCGEPNTSPNNWFAMYRSFKRLRLYSRFAKLRSQDGFELLRNSEFVVAYSNSANLFRRTYNLNCAHCVRGSGSGRVIF